VGSLTTVPTQPLSHGNHCRLTRGREPGSRKLGMQIIADRRQPFRRIVVEGATSDGGRIDPFHPYLDGVGHLLRNFTQADALSLAIRGHELDRAATVGLTRDACHLPRLSSLRTNRAAQDSLHMT